MVVGVRWVWVVGLVLVGGGRLAWGERGAGYAAGVRDVLMSARHELDIEAHLFAGRFQSTMARRGVFFAQSECLLRPDGRGVMFVGPKRAYHVDQAEVAAAMARRVPGVCHYTAEQRGKSADSDPVPEDFGLIAFGRARRPRDGKIFPLHFCFERPATLPEELHRHGVPVSDIVLVKWERNGVPRYAPVSSPKDVLLEWWQYLTANEVLTNDGEHVHVDTVSDADVADEARHLAEGFPEVRYHRLTNVASRHDEAAALLADKVLGTLP